MKPYRYALAVTSQFYFCGIPFRLDTAPKCSLNCLYCFAMSRGGRRTSVNLLVDPGMIQKKLQRAEMLDLQQQDIVGAFLKERLPIHFGGMSDPLANKVVISASRELLKVLADFEYPTVLSTKNTSELWKENTISLLKKNRYLIIQVSISSTDKLAEITEPNTPSVNERIELLHLLIKEGFHTIVRLQPLFPSAIDEVVSEIIPRLGEIGVKHVIAEFLKLPVETSISKISSLFRKMDWDGRKYYQDANSLRTGREWVLPPEYKWEKLRPVIASIHKYGMTYGAGDYGLNHLSDTDCCCGIDGVEGFGTFFKANIPFLIKRNKSEYLSFGEIRNINIPDKSIRMYMNSHCRLENAITLLDYLKVKWNRPGTENAPDTFLGIEWKGEYDDEGNCLYHKKQVD